MIIYNWRTYFNQVPTDSWAFCNFISDALDCDIKYQPIHNLTYEDCQNLMINKWPLGQLQGANEVNTFFEAVRALRNIYNIVWDSNRDKRDLLNSIDFNEEGHGHPDAWIQELLLGEFDDVNNRNKLEERRNSITQRAYELLYRFQIFVQERNDMKLSLNRIANLLSLMVINARNNPM